MFGIARAMAPQPSLDRQPADEVGWLKHAFSVAFDFFYKPHLTYSSVVWLFPVNAISFGDRADNHWQRRPASTQIACCDFLLRLSHLTEAHFTSLRVRLGSLE